MHSERYSIGLDFGTLSGRALLCRLSDGAEIASAVYEYPHGVMDDTFAPHPGVSKKLPAVGDLCITGIVNLSGFGGQMLLQTTRLSLVLELASFIAGGLRRCLCTPAGVSQFRSSLQRAK